jgi:hypothetical protein
LFKVYKDTFEEKKDLIKKEDFYDNPFYQPIPASFKIPGIVEEENLSPAIVDLGLGIGIEFDQKEIGVDNSESLKISDKLV